MNESLINTAVGAGFQMGNLQEAKSLLTSIFKSPQSVRNSLNKSEKHKLIIKDSTNKKLILLNPSLKVQVNGNVLLDYKFFANES